MNARARCLLAVVALLLAGAVDDVMQSLPTDDLRWLLGPVVGLVEWSDVATFEWEPGKGYLIREQRFVITRQCAGLRFLLVSTCLLGLAWRRRSSRWRDALRPSSAALAVGFAVTTLANATRIGVAVRLRELDLRGTGWSFDELHTLESLLVYLLALAALLGLARSHGLRALAGARSVADVRFDARRSA